MTFKRGDKVYYNNQEASFVCEVDDKHSLINFDGDIKEAGFLVVTASKLTTKQIDLFADIDAKRRDLEKELRDKRNEIRELDKVKEAKEQYLKNMAEKHKGFSTVIDFLEGKITHVVYKKYREIDIITLDEMLKLDEEDSYRDDLKLVTLFGNADKKLSCGVNQYSDGSGIYTEFYPVNSYEEGIQKASELIHKELEEYKGKGSSGSALKSAHMLGIESEHINEARNEYYESLRESLEKRKKKLKEDMDKIDKELDEMSVESIVLGNGPKRRP